MNQQYLMISSLESYSQTLNKNALLGQNTEDISQNMYNELKTQIIFSIKDREPIFILDQHYAHLTLYREDRLFTEFDLLILDRTATALAQLLMREFYIEEKRDIEDATILADWIDQKLSKEEIYKFIAAHHANYHFYSGTIFILSSPSTIMKVQEDIVYSKLYYRNLFEQNGFIPFLFERKAMLFYFTLYQR